MTRDDYDPPKVGWSGAVRELRAELDRARADLADVRAAVNRFVENAEGQGIPFQLHPLIDAMRRAANPVVYVRRPEKFAPEDGE